MKTSIEEYTTWREHPLTIHLLTAFRHLNGDMLTEMEPAIEDEKWMRAKALAGCRHMLIDILDTIAGWKEEIISQNGVIDE